MTDYLEFPAGLHLLSKWQAGDDDAKNQLRVLIDDACAGKYDARFAEPASTDVVHTTASVHMLGLDILNDLYGVTSAEYYKTDPLRYARVNLMASRLIGTTKHYTTWALYAFTCEAIGQPMMYPDKFPPGSDPDLPLISKDNWQSVIQTPDFGAGVPKIINDMLRESQKLSGMEPLLQLTAPYSLAADIYGQENLLADVLHDPDSVMDMLKGLADKVLAPWIAHFLNEFPDGWIELSDASGSPFFIGPENCKTLAIRSIQYLVDGKSWADRVFDCNYRGDYVTQAEKKGRTGRRRGGDKKTVGKIDLLELTDIKYDVCQDFIMRLDSDKVPVSFYEQQAIARNVSLTTGIGSPRIDSNSIPDPELAKTETETMAQDFVAAIKNVCAAVGYPDDAFIRRPWPSHVYFEDINARSEFDLIEIVVRTVREQGAFSVGT